MILFKWFTTRIKPLKIRKKDEGRRKNEEGEEEGRRKKERRKETLVLDIYTASYTLTHPHIYPNHSTALKTTY